jgi:hypothetical protein
MASRHQRFGKLASIPDFSSGASAERGDQLI